MDNRLNGAHVRFTPFTSAESAARGESDCHLGARTHAIDSSSALAAKEADRPWRIVKTFALPGKASTLGQWSPGQLARLEGGRGNAATAVRVVGGAVGGGQKRRHPPGRRQPAALSTGTDRWPGRSWAAQELRLAVPAQPRGARGPAPGSSHSRVLAADRSGKPRQSVPPGRPLQVTILGEGPDQASRWPRFLAGLVVPERKSPGRLWRRGSAFRAVELRSQF
jgi:hypothetical protein